MKGVCIFESQYGNNPDWSYIAACDATDFVFIPNDHPLSNSDAANMAAKIKAFLTARNGKTANIWIGTPGITAYNAWSSYEADDLTDFLQTVYDDLDPDEQNKVAGAYMNQERIYGGMDYNNVLNGSQQGNKQIRIMNQIRNYVKSGKIHGTKFMWCPYYGHGSDAATIIKEIGHVADKVQIFDYVILQPHTMFDPNASTGNLNGVKYSVSANKVCYRDNVNVIPSKVSSTQIGYEMEYATRFSYSTAVFNDYKDTFSSCKNKPCLFYWEGNNATTFAEVNSWF